MKKKSLLIFLLTAVSATTVAAAAGCAKKHQHTYSWQSTAEQHWQECDCHDKKDEGAHVDNINNATQAAGSDGKCDVCGRENYALTFNMNGHGTAPASQVIYKGGKAVKPATDPSAADCIFGGWYSDAACTASFDFTKEINAPVTVYAKWSVTLSFDANGHGVAPEAQTVKIGDKAVKPADPVDADAEYIFDGWYTDAICSWKFNFDYAVVEGGTLYAKWVPDTRPLVTFDMKGHGTAPAKQRVDVNGYAVKPATDPVDADGDYLFKGWYSDEDCTTAFDFENTPITADVTVYAKWVEDTRPLVTFDMGGYGEDDSYRVEAGSKVEKPEDPEVEHSIFEGWFSDEERTNAFDFENTEITADTVIYAKITYDKRAYVTFNMMGHGGDAPAVQKVEYGECATEPGAPVEAGLNFEGWYVGLDFDDDYYKFSFDEELTEDITLYAKWTATVTVDANGHGTVPAPLKVLAGAKLAESDLVIPVCDDMDFDGWYADAACETPFDFDSPVTTAVTVYVKWVASLPKLVLSGLPKNYTFGSENILQFSFVAPEAGRYLLEPYSAKTFDCYFTTNADEEGTYYGAGYASNEDKLSLNKNQKIIVTLYRGTGITDTDKVSLLISEITDEDLPAEGWVSGKYTDGQISLEFNKENKTVNWNGTDYPVTYLGGSFDYAKFIIGSNEYKLTQTAADTLELTYKQSSNSGQATATLKRVVPQERLDVSALSGLYGPESGKLGTVSEICVYLSGNGKLDSTKYTLGSGGSSYTFDGFENVLQYGNYKITPNVDGDGKVVSINVSNPTLANGSVPRVYTRTGDAPDEVPEKLPISTGLELVGATLGISSVYGTATWSDNTAITITAYSSATGVYTVKKGSTTYTLEIEGTGENTVIKVYNATHSALVDTLAKKTVQAKTFVTDGTTQNTFTRNDTSGNYKSMFYTVPVTGKYTITSSNKYIEMFTNIADFNVTGMGGISFASLTVTVDLTKDTVFALSISGCSSKDNSFWFTASVVEGGDTPDPGPDDPTPGGVTGSGTQADPYVLTEAGKVSVTDLNRTTKYFKFVASETGTYTINAYNEMIIDTATNNTVSANETQRAMVLLNIDGVKYGYSWMKWYYNNEDLGYSFADYAAKPAITITVTAGQEVVIELTGGTGATLSSFEITKQD